MLTSSTRECSAKWTLRKTHSCVASALHPVAMFQFLHHHILFRPLGQCICIKLFELSIELSISEDLRVMKWFPSIYLLHVMVQVLSTWGSFISLGLQFRHLGTALNNPCSGVQIMDSRTLNSRPCRYKDCAPERRHEALG